MIDCALCGYSFNKGSEMLCNHCPLHKKCDLTCCPNCGYAMITNNRNNRSKRRQRIFRQGKLKGRQAKPFSLGGCRKKCGTVVRGFSGKMEEKNKLFLLGRGIRPGKAIKVMQTSPAVVVEVDHLQVAIERELADLIYINNRAENAII